MLPSKLHPSPTELSISSILRFLFLSTATATSDGDGPNFESVQIFRPLVNPLGDFPGGDINFGPLMPFVGLNFLFLSVLLSNT
ncbi:hypothetical protein V6Z11_A02G052900 [Gossypium hirsutum]